MVARAADMNQFAQNGERARSKTAIFPPQEFNGPKPLRAPHLLCLLCQDILSGGPPLLALDAEVMVGPNTRHRSVGTKH